MKRTVIRYRTKPDKAEENARLVAAVFEELEAQAPDGVRYMALRLADDSFVHIVETEEGTSPLPQLAEQPLEMHALELGLAHDGVTHAKPQRSIRQAPTTVASAARGGSRQRSAMPAWNARNAASCGSGLAPSSVSTMWTNVSSARRSAM